MAGLGGTTDSGLLLLWFLGWYLRFGHLNLSWGPEQYSQIFTVLTPGTFNFVVVVGIGKFFLGGLVVEACPPRKRLLGFKF